MHRENPVNSPEHTDKPASATLAQLKDQTESVRSELALLRSELVTARQDGVDIPSTTLRDANEQLVLAALESDALADTATFKLHELTRSSQRDALTDTPNRALMLDRLQHAITLGRRHRTHVAVIFLDVDHFKAINDRLGHAVGDEVLKLVARRLESVVRASDTVSRHGGDEFLMLLADVSHSSAVAAIAAKVLKALSEPALIGESEIELSASIGIAMFPEDGDDPAALIALADEAMYRAKNRRRGTFAFHSGGTEADNGIAPPAYRCATEAGRGTRGHAWQAATRRSATAGGKRTSDHRCTHRAGARSNGCRGSAPAGAAARSRGSRAAQSAGPHSRRRRPAQTRRNRRGAAG